MNTSPGKTIFAPTTCLSADQLRLYSTHTLDKSAVRAVEEHLADCELCSIALDGFAAVAVSAADLHAINAQVDKLSGVNWFQTLGGKISIGLSSIVVLVAGVWFYQLQNAVKPAIVTPSVQVIAPATPAKADDPTVINPVPSLAKQETTNKSKPLAEISKPLANENYMEQVSDNNNLALSITNSNLNQQNLKFNPDNYANSNSIQNPRLNNQVQNTSGNSVSNVTPMFTPDDLVFTPEYNSQIQYLNGLKITDFDKLYYYQAGNLQPRDIPSPVEGRKPSESNEILREPVHTETAEAVLKSGLLYFKNQKYGDALGRFSELLDVNGGDINALFYTGICWYNLNKADRSIAFLDKVLNMKNNAFHEEALWYKALGLLLKKDNEPAKLVLQQISDEKGFYGKQAREKLKELK
jgi:hypothetical protein